MKKYIIVTYLFVCLFLVIACGSTSNSDSAVPVNENKSVSDTSDNSKSQEVTKDEEEALPTETEKEFVTVDEQVILDQDGVKVTLKSLSNDDFFGPSLDVLVENNTDKSITVQSRNTTINDVMVETLFSCDVAAGKKANDEITFMDSDLKTAQIETIKDIELVLHIFDTDTWDTIFDSDTINITTSADPSFLQEYDDSGFVALDQNDIKIVIKKLDSEDSFWGADIYVYIENNSQSNATIQLRDVSINGFMTDPIFSCDVVAGKKAFDTISFLESDLADNDIQSIDELEFAFHIYNMDNWNAIYDSEVISVSFE